MFYLVIFITTDDIHYLQSASISLARDSARDVLPAAKEIRNDPRYNQMMSRGNNLMTLTWKLETQFHVTFGVDHGHQNAIPAQLAALDKTTLCG